MDQDFLYDYKATLDTSVTRKSSVISILSSNPVDINYNTELEAPGSIPSPKESTDANKERSTRCLTDFLNVRGSAAPNSVTTRRRRLNRFQGLSIIQQQPPSSNV